MTRTRTGRSTDRAVSPILAMVALIAVSVTLVAVLGVWMLGSNSPAASGQISADVSIAFRDGEAVVHWTDKGTADQIKVVVGTESRVIEEVEGVVQIPATSRQTVVVVAEQESGNSAIIARARLSSV